jgi:hypothetical protein
MHFVAAIVFALLTATCVSKDDDDGETQGDDGSASSSEGATTETGSTSSAGDSTGDEPLTCVEAQEAAAMFVAANAACEVDADCTSVLALCVGEGQVCGALPVRVGYDEAAWAEIEQALSICTECGGDPCGACSACVAGTCTLALELC